MRSTFLYGTLLGLAVITAGCNTRALRPFSPGGTTWSDTQATIPQSINRRALTQGKAYQPPPGSEPSTTCTGSGCSCSACAK